MPGPRIISPYRFSYDMFPRHSQEELCEIRGGFAISLEEATRWANRILAEKQKQDPSINLVEGESELVKTLSEVVQEAGGVRVMMHGKMLQNGFRSHYFVIADSKVANAVHSGEEHVLTEEQKAFDAGIQERIEGLLGAEGVKHGGFEVYAMSLSERTRDRFFDLILQALPANGISLLSLDNDHCTMSISPEPVNTSQGHADNHSTLPDVLDDGMVDCEVQGGFVITAEQAVAWTNRLVEATNRGKAENDKDRLNKATGVKDFSTIRDVLNGLVRAAGGVECRQYGSRTMQDGGAWTHWMVVVASKVVRARKIGRDKYDLTAEGQYFPEDVIKQGTEFMAKYSGLKKEEYGNFIVCGEDIFLDY